MLDSFGYEEISDFLCLMLHGTSRQALPVSGRGRQRRKAGTQAPQAMLRGSTCASGVRM
jgi:hypothetical protein